MIFPSPHWTYGPYSEKAFSSPWLSIFMVFLSIILQFMHWWYLPTSPNRDVLEWNPQIQIFLSCEGGCLWYDNRVFFFCRSCGLDEMLTVPVGRLRTEYALLQAVAWLTMLKISKMIKCYGHVLNKVVIFQQLIARALASMPHLSYSCGEVMFLFVRFKSCLISKPHRLTSCQVIKISNLILKSHRQGLVGHPSTLQKNRRINTGMWS